MEKDSSAILSNKLLVPSDLVSNEDLKNWYYEWKAVVFTPREDDLGGVVYDENTNKPITDRTEEKRSLKTYQEIIKNRMDSYISIPRGNLEKLRIVLDNLERYRDLRPVAPLGVKLEVAELTKQDTRWKDQSRCADSYMKKGYGIVLGDTGSGKTIIGISCMCRLGMTTLILTSQTDGVRQWVKEIRKHTTIEQHEQVLGKELIGAYRPGKDPYPITVSTVQAFLHHGGKSWLKKNRSYFGLLLLDEVHDFGAQKFSKVVQMLNPFSLLGLTATVEREDQRHQLIYDMVGPVVATGTAHQMPPTVHFIETGVQAPEWIYQKPYPNHYQWNMLLKHIENSEERYRIIRRYLHKDLDDKRIIACVSQRVEVIRRLYELISKDGYDAAYVDGKTKSKAREAIYAEIGKKYKILFAGKVLNQLVDLPRVDCLHFVSPSSSHKVTKQVYGRARRWLEGKRTPIIRDYVDSGGQFDGAYKNRLELCRLNGWKIERQSTGSAILAGTGIWKPRHKQ